MTALVSREEKRAQMSVLVTALYAVVSASPTRNNKYAIYCNKVSEPRIQWLHEGVRGGAVAQSGHLQRRHFEQLQPNGEQTYNVTITKIALT